jgi:UDP-2,4-diacetamido-2,4,6-trideoxy-beta-L-altropyranose hydrolase
VIFAVAEMPPAIEQRLAGEGFSIARMPKPAGGSEDADATVKLARERGAAWVAIDGDRFDVAFLQRVKSGVASVLLIDDFAERESFPADLILNPNLDSTEGPYRKRGTLTPLLLGERYVMLRREFTAWRRERSFPEKGRKILVTLGGSDPDNLTPKISEALGLLPSYETTVIAGPGYRYLRELERARTPNVRVVVNAANMRELMAQADLAVIAGGGTLWELLYMGCAVLSYARNPLQSCVVATLASMNILADMGNTEGFSGPALIAKVKELSSSASLRERIANAGRRLIDGKGVQRVVEKMKGHEARR